MMPGKVDEATLEAARQLWQSDAMNLPLLVKELPQAGRLKTPRPLPYAHLACRQGPKPNERLTGITPGKQPRHDYRVLTITLYGVKADVVEGLFLVQQLFNVHTVLTLPDTDPTTGLPRFIRYWPLADGKLEEDPDTKDGLDVWKGIAQGVVWSVRLD